MIKKLIFVGRQAVIVLLLLCVVSSPGVGFVFDHAVAQVMAVDDCPCSQQRCCVEKSTSSEAPIPAVPFTRHQPIENSIWALTHHTTFRPIRRLDGRPSLPPSCAFLIDSEIGIYQLHCSYLI
ncbi:MAG: hypothetical protein HOI66_05260 [Verrucomicrobia bacterium]|nr:hypothetical protein [Verrucomicrobiota bacterium]